MNHIIRLQQQATQLEREVTALRAGINSLRAHLHSPKFNCGDRLDNYVNVADVLHWLRDVENDAFMAKGNV